MAPGIPLRTLTRTCPRTAQVDLGPPCPEAAMVGAALNASAEGNTTTRGFEGGNQGGRGVFMPRGGGAHPERRLYTPRHAPTRLSPAYSAPTLSATNFTAGAASEVSGSGRDGATDPIAGWLAAMHVLQDWSEH